MMKVILKLEFADEKTKQKAMKKVSGLSGLESISFDAKDRKLTVTGTIDPIIVVAKLRKICPTEIVSVGPAKEPEKKKDDPKKDDPKKLEDKKKEEMLKVYQAYYQQMQNPYYYQPQQAAPPSYPGYYQRSVDEDPNSCVIS